jgi:hypothetical protein
MTDIEPITSAEGVRGQAFYEERNDDNVNGWSDIPYVALPRQIQEMIQHELPTFMDLFLTRSLEYGDSASDLGPRGQFSDMYRKMIKLKTGMWEGKEEQLTSETVDEILLDLIGHCFLALQQRRLAGTQLKLR